MDRNLEDLQKRIVELALSYKDFQEKKGNSGFKDPEFEEKMKSIAGWRKGQAWCAYFAELVYKEAFTISQLDEMLPLLDKTFSANSQQTFRNFKKIGWTSDIPQVGAIAIIAYSGNSGHTYIVTEILTNSKVKTIEGNTSDKVSEKTRSQRFDGLLGYIIPKV